MRILIADDSVVSRHLLEATLRKWGYEVVVADDGLEAWNVLQGENPPRLAILDWVMPGLTGPEVCSRVRESSRNKDLDYTYIVLLSSKSQREDLIEGLEAGADDYLTKPFDQHELKVRLRAGTRIIDLQRELVSAREELREQATKDFLTRIWNRSSILDVLNRELSQTFYEFVNAYRVDEVRARLADPAAKHLNILALGLEAGFASKSTFNQAFKKLTGQTPSTYRKALETRKALAG